MTYSDLYLGIGGLGTAAGLSTNQGAAGLTGM